MKKKKYLIILITLASVFVFTYFLMNNIIGTKKLVLIKQLIPVDVKVIIKKYFFPHKVAKAKKENRELLIKVTENDIQLKESLQNIIFINKNKTLKKNELNVLFFLMEKKNQILKGIHNYTPGSGYLEYYEDKLFLLSSVGIIGYSDINLNILNFKQIENNIDNFINKDQFLKGIAYSVRDLKIFDGKVYVSLIKEIRNNCWNTSIIYSELNYDKLDFKKLFIPNECINAPEIEGFNAGSSGGRIVKLNKDFIAFSTGEFLARDVAQIEDSIFGKILKINILTGKHEIISLGHRNPQGLFFDETNEYLVSSEHGPKGGDELNLIYLNSIKKPNYGWPIASYGEHYDGLKNKINYKKYPLLKPHKKYGFVEPLKYFTPSIAPSEIIRLNNNKYVLSSLKGKQLFIFNLNNNNKLINLESFEIGERIRDLAYGNNLIFLFLEDTASIGIIKDNVIN